MNASETSHLGYVLSPPRRHNEPGYSCLDVWLTDLPSGLHFDPRQLRLLTQDESGDLGWTTIEHPNIGAGRLRACAGPVDLIGFGEKRLEVFTFGGELVVKTEEEYTLAVLSSEAPILARVSSHAESVLLMEEAEVLLALRRGVWDEQPGEFDRRLMAAEPLELYHAFLETILTRMKSLPRLRGESDQHLLYQLRLEVDYLEEHVSRTYRPIDTIL